MSAGKGMQPRKGYNQAKYVANYDAIFRTNQRKEPMKTPEQEQPDPQPILPWHIKAANAVIKNGDDGYRVPTAAIIAHHDPSQEALHLLVEAEEQLVYRLEPICGGTRIHPDCVKSRIRAHLAAHSKPDETKGSK